ncbi:unnamed protein product, partial [Nesidiocoris tenuis]
KLAESKAAQFRSRSAVWSPVVIDDHRPSGIRVDDTENDYPHERSCVLFSSILPQPAQREHDFFRFSFHIRKRWPRGLYIKF